jgi:hypothetical protein
MWTIVTAYNGHIFVIVIVVYIASFKVLFTAAMLLSRVVRQALPRPFFISYFLPPVLVIIFFCWHAGLDHQTDEIVIFLTFHSLPLAMTCSVLWLESAVCTKMLNHQQGGDKSAAS